LALFGAVCRSSMAVSEVKIAKNQGRIREEDEISRPAPVHRPVDRALGRPGWSKPANLLMQTGPSIVPPSRLPGSQAGPQAGPTGPWAGQVQAAAVSSPAAPVSSSAMLLDATAVVACSSWRQNFVFQGRRHWCFRRVHTQVFSTYLDLRRTGICSVCFG
jgi:hypothetical protein